MPPGPVAVLSEESTKGQDRHESLELESISAFGVFDGHGGIECSQALKEALLPKILGPGAFPGDEQIVDSYWALDQAVGADLAAQGNHAGSTCTVLVVGTDGAGGYRCKLAWVGDSCAYVISMTGGQTLQYITTLAHTPYVEAEKTQLLQLAAVCKVVRKLRGKEEDQIEVRTAEEIERNRAEKIKKIEAKRAAGAKGTALASVPGRRGGPPAVVRQKSEKAVDDGIQPQWESEAAVRSSREEAEEEEDATEDLVRLAFAELGLPTPPGVLALYCRAFRRERLIQKAFPRNVAYRRRCFIHKRAVEKDRNEPLVVATDDDPFSPHHKDLMMSRSICDWTKCAWVLPHPQLLDFTVAAGEHKRVILASDGLWDVISPEDAVIIARDSPSVDAAAELLMRRAKDEYLTKRGLAKMGDDTTVMVIDLNPSNVMFAARGGRGTGCCVVA